jgi:hypothetical protein
MEVWNDPVDVLREMRREWWRTVQGLRLCHTQSFLIHNIYRKALPNVEYFLFAKLEARNSKHNVD